MRALLLPSHASQASSHPPRMRSPCRAPHVAPRGSAGLLRRVASPAWRQGHGRGVAGRSGAAADLPWLGGRAEGGEEEWWKEEGALMFTCTECGKCCTAEGDVWANPEETSAMAAHLGASLSEFISECTQGEEEGAEGWVRLKHVEAPEGSSSPTQCIFLEDGKKCTMYQHRPLQCSTFPYWPSVLKTREAWEAAAGACEGINHEEAESIDPTHAYNQHGITEAYWRRFPWGRSH